MDQWVVTGVTHLVYLLEHELLTLNHCFGRVHFDNSEPVFGRVHFDDSEPLFLVGFMLMNLNVSMCGVV